MNIGMVGIGMMGHGIAGNLLRHGHRLVVMEHPGNQPLDALKSAGAIGVATAAEVAARSELVILVLTGSPQVEAPGSVALSHGSWDEAPVAGT